MGFANPARPIDYTLISDIVTGAEIDYQLVRQAADQALASTDATLTTVLDLVEETAGAAALTAVASSVALRQPSPVVTSWTSTRLGHLAALLAAQAALDAVAAELAATPDASPEAAAVVDDLTARRAALWALVKVP